MQAMCTHTRTELIARRDGVDYIRCLDCGQVFDAEDLESSSTFDDDKEPDSR
jgi:hypothetical protein